MIALRVIILNISYIIVECINSLMSSCKLLQTRWVSRFTSHTHLIDPQSYKYVMASYIKITKSSSINQTQSSFSFSNFLAMVGNKLTLALILFLTIFTYSNGHLRRRLDIKFNDFNVNPQVIENNNGINIKKPVVSLNGTNTISPNLTINGSIITP